MKKTILIILCLLRFISSKSACLSDTTILLEEKSGEEYIQKIYIGKFASDSDFYHSTGEFKIHAKKNKTEYNKSSFQGKWVTLNLYNNNFYIYAPCDEGNNYRLQIENNTLIEYLTEPNIYQILDIKQISKYKKKLFVVGPNGDKTTFYLHYVTNDICIFEKKLDLKKSIFHLLISTANMKKIPIIINQCSEKKSEFSFDLLNYDLILNLIKCATK